MKATEIKVGDQFKSGYTNKEGHLVMFDKVYTVYKVTDKRICYTDGRAHFAGATNRRVKGSWLTVKGFQERIDMGWFVIL